MSRARFDATESLALLGELVRLTAPPAGHEEICGQGLALAAKALGSTGGLLLMNDGAGAEARVAASWGSVSVPELMRLGARALGADETIEERRKGAKDGSPERVALVLPGDTGPVGALVLERPAHWGPEARAFASSAGRALTASLRAARLLDESRRQGELLARRNVELEALRELAGKLQGRPSEDEMLDATLALVLEKLGLQAGWIFWGESTRGKLELAAARGVADEFVEQAKTNGIGECLCQDVFATGRLRMARNTTECPRLPHLVRGKGWMAHACIPLKFERGVLGVMNICNRPGQVFSDQELHFLETVGNQLCLAIDKARTEQSEMRSNAEARALAALARALGGSLEQDRVLAAVGNYARELLAADRCTIILGDDPARLWCAFLAGPPMEGMEVGQEVDLEALGSRALSGTLRERRTLVVQDAAKDSRANAELAGRWNIGSAILVPLIAHGRLEGLLQADRAVPSAWSQEEVELADALARQAAVAISNARLYREAKEALVRLQQAQYGMMRAERMAAIGTLASSLAHEVRNPLNSISLNLVLLSRRLSRLEPGAQQELSTLVETARSEIKRLDSLVEEFLSLSSIDRIVLAEADAEEVVRDVLGLMGPVARTQGVTIESRLAGSLPRLRLDREKIKQVLLNLVRNAIEAMPEGGALTVTSRGSSEAVALDVTDTGVGIPEGLDVFDFFTTTKSGGTGLGLPIARRIVEAHGGTLTYESEPGRGTTFTVTLRLS